MQVDFNEL